ncbi:MAG: FkbM family methyltransferase [Beijerinckiaceae bacterium]|nr:FkbM family methyltransferase [Beijerinckiaceae bacterium]
MKFQVGAVTVDLIERDDRICKHIAKGHGFEPRSLQIWGDLCATRSGMFLDVGAYTGLFAIAASLHGRSVMAFEPMPKNAARFIENAEANGARRNIQFIEAAVGDRVGQVSIVYNPNVDGLTSGASLVRRKGVPLSVPLVMIDWFDLENVSAIKIDVERGEPEVLRGAIRTIERCKPAILVEVLDDERKDGVRAALPGYEVVEQIDERNWLMMPC